MVSQGPNEAKMPGWEDSNSGVVSEMVLRKQCDPGRDTNKIIEELKAERDRYRQMLESLRQSARDINEVICSEFIITTVNTALAGKE